MFVKEIICFLLSYNLFVDAIFGGEYVTNPHEYPWMVGFESYEVENNQPINIASCGGAIISKNMILTAAHCVEHGWPEFSKGSNYSLKTGIIVGMGHSSLDQSITLNVKSKLIHPKYFRNPEEDQTYDIALLELSEDLKFNNQIQPIALPEEEVDETNYLDKSRSKFLVAGWGVTFEIPNDFYLLVKSSRWTMQKSKIPKEKYLKYCDTPEDIKFACEDYQEAYKDLITVKPGLVQLVLQYLALCENQESSKCEDDLKLMKPTNLKVTEVDYIKLGSDSHNDKKENMPLLIHARSTKPNIPGTCDGDSGSPLMKLDNISGKYEVIGVVSGLKQSSKQLGPKGCLGPMPILYTRVSAFLPWIKENMAKASNPDLFMQLYQHK